MWNSARRHDKLIITLIVACRGPREVRFILRICSSTDFYRLAAYTLFTAAIFISVVSVAQDRDFTGLGDGTSWEDPLNWAPNDVPNSAVENDIIVIKATL
jgi:hypothetical protein